MIFNEEHDLMESVREMMAYRQGNLTFTFNTAAFQAKILRGDILAMPRAQFETAAGLAPGRMVTLIFGVALQVLVTSLRSLGDKFIRLVKGRATAFLVTVYYIMDIFRLAFNRLYDFCVYIWAAVIYPLIVEGVQRIIQVLEPCLNSHFYLAPTQASLKTQGT